MGSERRQYLRIRHDDATYDAKYIALRMQGGQLNTQRVRSNRLFDTNAHRRTFASLWSSPLVAGQLQR